MIKRRSAVLKSLYKNIIGEEVDLLADLTSRPPSRVGKGELAVGGEYLPTIKEANKAKPLLEHAGGFGTEL